MSEMVRLVNTRPTYLTAPAATHPEEKDSKGNPVRYSERRLIPGGNNVPMGYLEALMALDPSKGPGKVWHDWVNMEWVLADSDDGAAERPEGPEPPRTLEGVNIKGAQVFIGEESDPFVLRRWYRTDRRKGVKEAVAARLTSLGHSVEEGSGSGAQGASEGVE